MDATGEGGTGADPCAAAAALTADSITCSPNAMKTGAGSATASATEGNEYCVWDGAALTGANPSASVLVTQAPASGTGHAYLDVKLGTQPDLSLYINSNSGTLSPSLGAGWGSGSDPGVGFPSQICIRIREVSGMVIGEYADPVIGWQPFAMANETLDSPVAVTVGVVSSSALTTKATFSELGTGTAP